MTSWNEAMDNSLRESVLRNYFNFTLIALQLSTSRHTISADACRKRWTFLHKQRLVIPPKPPRKHVLDISDVDFSKQTSPSIFGGLTTPSSFNIFRDSLKDTFQKMDEKVAELLPEVPDIDADDQESDEETVPLDFRTAMIDNKVVIQAKPLTFKTDEEIMQEELEMPTLPEIGKSGALQPQNYEAFLNTIKQTSFAEDDASVTVIQPEVDLEKELSMIDLPCNLNPSLNNDLKAPKATASPKPLILRRNSEDQSPKANGKVIEGKSSLLPKKKEKENSMSLDSILAAQGTSIEALLDGEEGLDLDLGESTPTKEEELQSEEEEVKEKQERKVQQKSERKREGGRHVEKTIERMRKRSHSRSKTPPRQNGGAVGVSGEQGGENSPKKEANYYKTARLRATLADESDDEDDKFFIQSRKSTREILQLPEEKVWRDWESMGTYDSIYGTNDPEERKERKEKEKERKELEAQRDDFLATFVVPGQKRPGKPGGGRKTEKKKEAPLPRKAPEWEEKARLRREKLRAERGAEQAVFRHETKQEEQVSADEQQNGEGEMANQLAGAMDEWRTAFN